MKQDAFILVSQPKHVERLAWGYQRGQFLALRFGLAPCVAVGQYSMNVNHFDEDPGDDRGPKDRASGWSLARPDQGSFHPGDTHQGSKPGDSRKQREAVPRR